MYDRLEMYGDTANRCQFVEHLQSHGRGFIEHSAEDSPRWKDRHN